jgi:hypothetical protein
VGTFRKPRPAIKGALYTVPSVGTGSTTRDDPRREKRRFPIQRDVSYYHLKGDVTSPVGVGKTLEMSSHEVRFTAHHALRPGQTLRLLVAWPAVLDNLCKMNLEICGWVVASQPGTVVIRIARYEFRTRTATMTAAT